ncbi:MAG: PadR family transcriptional regulator [Acidobacteria bacterium]|nr:PadR family transcriptional regulator [Acidobacteriota bacterium]
MRLTPDSCRTRREARTIRSSTCRLSEYPRWSAHTVTDTPMTPLSMHLLLALAEQPRHGYGLMQAVREQSDGAVRPGTGSLYAALQRLLDDGLIGAEDDGEGRRGTRYRLTRAGADAALAEAGRLQRVLALANRRDLLPDAGGR